MTALAPLGVHLAVAPLAPGGAAACQCTTGPHYGRAGSSGSSGQAEYLEHALTERPGLFTHATYFAAHAYPTDCNAALEDGRNLPKEMGGNATWMSSVKATLAVDRRSAAPPSPFNRLFNKDGERVSAK